MEGGRKRGKEGGREGERERRKESEGVDGAKLGTELTAVKRDKDRRKDHWALP